MMGKPFHAATDNRLSVRTIVPANSATGLRIGAAGNAKRGGRRTSAVGPNSLIFRSESPIQAVTMPNAMLQCKVTKNTGGTRPLNPREILVIRQGLRG